ncbi:MAG: 4'-phosphopantetheinyl transferase superfamily protein [Pasteurellaceae bacterium]|nr:4'-phosphopantetheinyl transferase superfamily protein [Pasteurellaceae bacterium]
MATYVAWGNIQQTYPSIELPAFLQHPKLNALKTDNPTKHQRQRCRWVAHFLLFELIQKTRDFLPAVLPAMQYSATGRPFFPIKNLDFNISHSGDWVAVALTISENAELGIDIEYPKKRHFGDLLAHFANPNEQHWFAQQANAESAFYRCWCIREAILKAQGVGIGKLGDVKHYPEQFILQSPHCSQGQLLFTREFPFYLALFIASSSENSTHYFNWNGQLLQPTRLLNADHYQVNS